MSDTKPIFTIPHAKIIALVGKPLSLVQHYYFNCPKCNSGLRHQPQYMKNVPDGLQIMCQDCAKREGFEAYHFEGMEREEAGICPTCGSDETLCYSNDKNVYRACGVCAWDNLSTT